MGAINAISKELVLVTNTGYITSIQVCEMLVKIAARRSHAIPITIVLDNARYQRCKSVLEKAAELRIELLFLPPYSPNLNLLKDYGSLSKRKFYIRFITLMREKFTTAIMECLSQTQTKHKKALDSLLSLKFQTFTETSI